MDELRAYEPTWRDRLARVLMGDGRASPERRALAQGITGSTGLGPTGMGLVDLTPVGVPMAVQEAAAQGDARGAVMAVVPPMKYAGNVAKSSLSELLAKTQADMAARKVQAESLAAAGSPVRMQHQSGRSALVSPDMSKPGQWRITYLDENGPSGHFEFPNAYEATYAALREGFAPSQKKAP